MKHYELVTRAIGTSVAKLKRASPTIFSAVSIAGVFVTSALSAKGALDLSKKDDRSAPPITRAKCFVTCFAPAVLTGAATSACIICSDRLNKKTQASLLSAYAVLRKSYEEYKEAVKEELGEEAELSVRKNISKKSLQKDQPETPEWIDSSGAVLFYDEFSDRYFYRTMLEVLDAEYQLNRKFTLFGYASLNDFYNLLGLKETEFGEAVGWSVYLGSTDYGYQWIDFEHHLFEEDDPDAPDYYLIHMPFPPHQDYLS